MRKRRFARAKAFSLVEMALALGIATFALVSLLALLPVGIKTNQVSTEETRAVFLLSALEADLRNTHPQATGNGTSQLFGLVLPYKMDALGARTAANTAVPMGLVSPACSVGLNDDEKPVPYSGSPRPRYQATVLYTKVPAAGSSAPIQARLIVNWPAVPDANPAKLTSLKSVAGYVEAYVTFPAP